MEHYKPRTVGLVREDVVDDCRVPDGLLDCRAVLARRLADVLRVMRRVEHVSQVGELHAQHRVCGGQER
jgi:hypothetical protein